MERFARTLLRLHTLVVCAGVLMHQRTYAQSCDTTEITVQIGYTVGADYQYLFEPVIDTNGHVVLGHVWQFSSGAPDQTSDVEPFVQFPGPGPQLVCLRVDALVNGQPCDADRCTLIDVPEDTTGCAGVSNDFTIEFVDPEIMFISQSVSQAPITEYMWDFGDGTTGTGFTVTHGYADFGAYYVCLTIATGGCTTTHCRWLYWGPADLPCDSLLTADFQELVLGRTVALVDASTASGMDISVDWDLGDGSMAQGPAVVHTYASDGVYNVCASVNVTGQLVQDSCVLTVCHDVFVFQELLGVAEAGRADAPRAYPLPFTDRVTVESPWITRGTSWRALDVTGRVLLTGTSSQARTLVLDLATLQAGPLVLHLQHGDRQATVRLLKQ